MYRIRDILSLLQEYKIPIESKNSNKQHILSSQNNTTITFWGLPENSLTEHELSEQLIKFEKTFSIDKNDFLQKLRKIHDK